jgi:hypothetical protein
LKRAQNTWQGSDAWRREADNACLAVLAAALAV